MSTIARLAAPEGGGKNALKVLYALDGMSGSLDPTFAAHTLPVLHWSTAVWEDWIPKASLQAAYWHAKGKLDGKTCNWNRAAGPVAALWLTIERMNWKWKDPFRFVDDVGEVWSALADPPSVIVAAVTRTVRRRRLMNITAMHPGLWPPAPDLGTGMHGTDIAVDFASTLAPIANGRVSKLADAPEFERKHASALLSAVAGGQWPQAR